MCIGLVCKSCDVKIKVNIFGTKLHGTFQSCPSKFHAFCKISQFHYAFSPQMEVSKTVLTKNSWDSWQRNFLSKASFAEQSFECEGSYFWSLILLICLPMFCSSLSESFFGLPLLSFSSFAERSINRSLHMSKYCCAAVTWKPFH